MSKLIVKWLVNSVALLAVVHLIPGTSVSNWTTLIVAALILGLINLFFKPIILILTLPINIVTLGLFTLIINTGRAKISRAITIITVKKFTLNLLRIRPIKCDNNTNP